MGSKNRTGNILLVENYEDVKNHTDTTTVNISACIDPSIPFIVCKVNAFNIQFCVPPFFLGLLCFQHLPLNVAF